MTDFSIKMGFYKIMGENSKDVSITFDGETVGSLTVTSQDVDSPQYIEFTVHKDPGVYPCEISVTSNLSDGESVGLSTFYVKPADMEDWFDIKANGNLNTDGSLVIKEISSCKTYGALWYDEPLMLKIEVVGPRADPPRPRAQYRYGFTTVQDALDYSIRRLDELGTTPEWNQGRIDKKTILRDILNDPTIRY
jgi:hypothetical protein